MQRFYLERHEDVSGVSGTGRIAEGVIFSNGKVALSWLTQYHSIGIYDSLEQCRAIHGHDGKTDIVPHQDLPNSSSFWHSAGSGILLSLREI